MISNHLILKTSPIFLKIMRNNLENRALNYQSALEALNQLQSNAVDLKNSLRQYDDNDKLENNKKYLLRSGMSLEELDGLSLIHVAGTKGKGSTCAFTEIILRKHGYKTGLYTSPHLISVRERIRIDGKAISETEFTKYFWLVYKKLEKTKSHDTDMPSYFQFLTILMFNIFNKLSIDVGIIEVGIGGEYDYTNIIRKPKCVGITMLDFDHTSLLGNTIESIAYQKSGIFKYNVPAFTIKQRKEALNVLYKRSEEKQCCLNIVPDISSFKFNINPPKLGINADIQYSNASLAIKLTETWLNNESKIILNDVTFLKTVEIALKCCQWPGRTQILHGKSADFYLDGAHTVDSIKNCCYWFSLVCKKGPKILIFNTTGNRDNKLFLNILKSFNFDKAYFVPNISGKNTVADQENKTITLIEQMKNCQLNQNYWGKINGFCAPSVSHAFDEILYQSNSNNYYDDKKIQILITGSLHLIGSALLLLDPNLTMTTKY